MCGGRKKKEADNISYLIDEFIEKEILYYNDENRRNIAIEFLSLTRYDRRILGISFDEFIKKYRTCDEDYVARRFGVFGDVTIGFLMHGNKITLEQCMELMNTAIMGYSHFEGYKSKKVIMIGVNAKLSQWKFGYNPKVEKLKREDEEDLIRVLKQLNWFSNVEMLKLSSDEYPEE